MGIRFKNNSFEVNITMGNQITKYIGRFKTIEKAREKRHKFLLDSFISNLNKKNLNPHNIKEIPFIKNYFVCKEGYVLNKFGNIITGHTDKGGYKEINIKGKNYLVHRLILRTFKGNEDYKNLDVNHIDGNKTNNKIENLEWCIRKDNVIHSFKHGLQNNIAGRPVVTKDILEIFIKYRQLGYTYKKYLK